MGISNKISSIVSDLSAIDHYNEVESVIGDINELGDEIDELEDENKELKRKVEKLEEENDELSEELEEQPSLTGEMSGYNTIEYRTTNPNDERLMDLIGAILDSGWTTNQLADEIEAKYKGQIKVMY